MAEHGRYEIKVEGRIGERWRHWFDGMAISVHTDGRAPAVTTLTGPLADEAALLGLLQRLYTLGLTLLLVRREER
jgi:hypothetical protein